MRHILAFALVLLVAPHRDVATAGSTESISPQTYSVRYIEHQATRGSGSRVLGANTSQAVSADPTLAENWLAQKVCVDKSGELGRIDPYTTSNAFGDACPSGYSIRNLRETDSVPYYKYFRPTPGDTNVTHYRYTNAYETFDISNRALFVMDRQFAPSNVPSDWYVRQSFYPGSTHWDTYAIGDGWVSNVATRDNTGLNQTFYGNLSGTPTPDNGWIDFPTSYVSTLANRPRAQSTFVPVHGVYWEQSGDPWPVPTPSLSQQDPDTETTWKLLSGYTFDSGKTMDTLVSFHQSRPVVAGDNPDSGHMELWYFTVPYGPTRWEVWSAASCLASSCRSYIQSGCAGVTATMTVPYNGSNYTYYRTNCADWEQGVLLSYQGSTVPTLPLPQQNLLANFHFSSDRVDTSQRATAWEIADSLQFVQLQSSAPGDTGSGRYPGLRYAKMSCGTRCSSGASLSQSIVLKGGGVYSFGAEIRASSPGTIRVSLSQLDKDGQVLGKPSVVTAPVDSRGDGSNCATLGGIENCAVYIGERDHLVVEPGAEKLRIALLPLVPGIDYDVTDVFLSRL
jgi:hypothetical protein